MATIDGEVEDCLWLAMETEVSESAQSSKDRTSSQAFITPAIRVSLSFGERIGIDWIAGAVAPC